MTVYIYGARSSQFSSYRAARSGPARTVTFITDSTTLAAATGSGHVIAHLCGYRSRTDADVIDAQITAMVDGGRATTRQDPVVA